MVYENSILTAFILFPFIALLLIVPYIFIQYNRYGSINKVRTLIVFSFFLYMLCMYFLIILPLPSFEEVANMTTPYIQPLPFQEMIKFFQSESLRILDPRSWWVVAHETGFISAIYNVIMTIPFGMYLRYYFKCDLKKTILFSFLLSLFFELTQLSALYGIYPRPYRLFDADDFVTNTFGGFLGYYLVGGLMNLLPSRDKIDADTLKEGRKVSGFRRFVMFIFDGLILTILYRLIHIVVSDTLAYLFSFVFYYGLIPYWLKGMTWMGKVLNVKIEFFDQQHKDILFLLRYIALYIIYFRAPSYLLYLVGVIVRLGIFTGEQAEWFEWIMVAILAFYYLYNVIQVFRNKRRYYNRFFSSYFVSTIK